MRLAELAPEVVDEIRRYRYDRIIEKHEGPERWESELEYGEPDFLELAGRQVLLPVDKEQHPNITLLRAVVSDDGTVLTLFLRDTTYGEQWFECGFLAVCERFPGQEFYLATVYHEWFLFENPLKE
jgi:hypothetical protein